MNLDHAETLVICISPGIKGRWDVSEKGSDSPLATFSRQEDACDYARVVSQRSRRAKILIEDRDGFSPLSLRRERSGFPDQHRRA